MTARLALGIAAAPDWPDDQPVAAVHPPPGADLTPLGDNVTVIHPVKPAHDAFAAQGYRTVARPDGRFAAAVVFAPRDRAEARGLIAEALVRTDGGPVLLDGPKVHGVEAILREARAVLAVGEAQAKAHGKIALIRGEAPRAWGDAAAPAPNAAGFLTQAGLFSADRPDPGSVRLAEALPADLGGRVADLGAGWGYLASRILERRDVEACDLIEADCRALDCARANVADPRAAFLWADAGAITGAYDAVVTNPPFHGGRAADPALGQAFVAAASRILTSRGALWLVANRHLPYEEPLRRHFAEVDDVPGSGPFKVFRGARPSGAQGRGRRH